MAFLQSKLLFSVVLGVYCFCVSSAANIPATSSYLKKKKHLLVLGSNKDLMCLLLYSLFDSILQLQKQLLYFLTRLVV